MHLPCTWALLVPPPTPLSFPCPHTPSSPHPSRFLSTPPAPRPGLAQPRPAQPSPAQGSCFLPVYLSSLLHCEARDQNSLTDQAQVQPVAKASSSCPENLAAPWPLPALLGWWEHRVGIFQRQCTHHTTYIHVHSHTTHIHAPTTHPYATPHTHHTMHTLVHTTHMHTPHTPIRHTPTYAPTTQPYTPHTCTHLHTTPHHIHMHSQHHTPTCMHTPAAHTGAHHTPQRTHASLPWFCRAPWGQAAECWHPGPDTSAASTQCMHILTLSLT